jgi:hypothetical protein
MLAAIRRSPAERNIWSSVTASLGTPEPMTARTLQRKAAFDDLLPNDVLLIRRTKFGKSRLVPLHPCGAHDRHEYELC